MVVRRGRRVPLLYQNSCFVIRQEQIVLILMRGAINFGACYLLDTPSSWPGPYNYDLQCVDQR